MGGAHRLVAGEHGPERVDGCVAELGGDGEQVVRARRPSGLAALSSPIASVSAVNPARSAKRNVWSGADGGTPVNLHPQRLVTMLRS